jgi:hypothetical protein
LQDDDRIITQLLETVEDLMKQSPDLFRTEPSVKPEKSLLTPTPPRRNRVSEFSCRQQQRYLFRISFTGLFIHFNLLEKNKIRVYKNM